MIGLDCPGAISLDWPRLPSDRPYLTLALLVEPEEIIQQLPADASPLLVRLVHCANPLRSLEQLADETGIEMRVFLDEIQNRIVPREQN